MTTETTVGGHVRLNAGLDADTWDRKITRVADQRREARAGATVTCACDRTQHYLYMYKCYYCGEFYCERCAPDHFGGTRDEYKARSASNTESSRHTPKENCE